MTAAARTPVPRIPQRAVLQASSAAARRLSNGHELVLNAASLSGLLLSAVGDPRRAIALVDGPSVLAQTCRGYLRQVALEERDIESRRELPTLPEVTDE